MGEFAKLDPLLHSELRLAVMSTLLTMEEADFVYLREATGATARCAGLRRRGRGPSPPTSKH